MGRQEPRRPTSARIPRQRATQAQPSQAQPSQAQPSPAPGDEHPRRIVRRVSPRSPHGILLRVIQEVLDPDWSPAAAAKSIVSHARGELGPLRAARRHLLTATMDRVTVSGTRALATLNMAIAEIEDRVHAPTGPPADDDAAEARGRADQRPTGETERPPAAPAPEGPSPGRRRASRRRLPLPRA